jgi:hypothetical protein
MFSKKIAVSFQSCFLRRLLFPSSHASSQAETCTGFKDFKDFKVTSVENTEKCFKTLTSSTKDGEEK